MDKERYDAEEISRKLGEADVLLGRGQTIGQVCEQLGITGQMYDSWRKACGRPRRGMKPDQAERLKALEAENERLRHALAVLTVDRLILEEVIQENV